MQTSEWMASANKSWGVSFSLQTYRNPRERLLLFCDVIGDCWVSRRGVAWVDGIEVPIQRAAYGLFVAPIRKGDVILPLCGNRQCCCPDHLHLVPREAIKGAAKARRKNQLVSA